MHMAATCLHYGQEAFEGLKAYRCPDGKVRVFRPDENAARLQSTCRGILMPELPTEKFIEMVEKVVKLNEEFIPPYESGATLYIRPLLIGTSAQVGVHPASEYLFLIFVTPVGPYFKGGFSTNPYVIIRDHDRSAPLGTGIYKVGGNYAASLQANNKAHELGYACEFYLDAKEKKYIDECGAANFFGIKNNTYVTPKSTSILPSITNKSLMQLAEDLGMGVERRQIPEEELETFEEERRLFYVGITRAKNALYLFEYKNEDTTFINELLDRGIDPDKRSKAGSSGAFSGGYFSGGNSYKDSAYGSNYSDGLYGGSRASGNFAPKVKLYGGRDFTGKKNL
jgi:branched-chain amino acid aminotransferase group II